MSYTKRYEQTEEQLGKPMKQIIKELLAHHTRAESAEILHVNPATFWRWMKRAGLRRCYFIGDDCTPEGERLA